MNALKKKIVNLVSVDQNTMLKVKVSEALMYVVKDIANDRFQVDEPLTKEDYKKLTQILDTAGLPNPLIHEGHRKKPHEALKRKFQLLTGEYNAGNDALLPKIQETIKELYEAGIFNSRLYKDAMRLYSEYI